METAEISEHQVAVFEHLKDGAWKTSAEVALATRIAGRTARHHLTKLVALGVLEEARIFPGHRYRLNGRPSARAAEFVKRLKDAGEIFGETS